MDHAITFTQSRLFVPPRGKLCINYEDSMTGENYRKNSVSETEVSPEITQKGVSCVLYGGIFTDSVLQSIAFLGALSKPFALSFESYTECPRSFEVVLLHPCNHRSSPIETNEAPNKSEWM